MYFHIELNFGISIYHHRNFVTKLMPQLQKHVSYLAKQQQRFLQFVLQNFGFNLFQGTAIDAEQTTTAFAVSYSGGCFLKTKKYIMNIKSSLYDGINFFPHIFLTFTKNIFIIK